MAGKRMLTSWLSMVAGVALIVAAFVFAGWLPTRPDVSRAAVTALGCPTGMARFLAPLVLCVASCTGLLLLIAGLRPHLSPERRAPIGRSLLYPGLLMIASLSAYAGWYAECVPAAITAASLNDPRLSFMSPLVGSFRNGEHWASTDTYVFGFAPTLSDPDAFYDSLDRSATAAGWMPLAISPLNRLYIPRAVASLPKGTQASISVEFDPDASEVGVGAMLNPAQPSAATSLGRSPSGRMLYDGALWLTDRDLDTPLSLPHGSPASPQGRQSSP